MCGKLSVTSALETKQTASAENLVSQSKISATSNIPSSPGVDLRHGKGGKSGGNNEFLH